ncbi:MAG: MFS transporter [Planctomycetota bacterium]
MTSTPPDYTQHPGSSSGHEPSASGFPEAGGQISAGSARLAVPIVAHVGVDYFSFVTIALLPLLAVKLEFGPAEKSMLLGIGAVASGGIQPIAAWIGDKLDSRMFGPIGIAVAALCISSIGYAESFGVLLALFAIGAMGVGAFHPPAAAAVGHLAGKRRSAMISLFFLAGMVGGIAGNVFSPMLVQLLSSLSGEEGTAATEAGLKSLVWMAPFGFALAAIVWWAIRKLPHRHAGAHDEHRSLPKRERRDRWAAFWLLYGGNVIRFSVNMSLVYLYVEWIERLVLADAGAAVMTETLGVRASAINGPLQAAMQVGMGGAGIVLGFVLTARWEKRAFVLIPLVGAIPIALFPYADRLAEQGLWLPVVLAGLLAVLSGIGFGSVIPVALALGQRLLPHRTAFASGMLLGGAWVFAFIGANTARVLHVGAAEGSIASMFAAPFGLVGEGIGLDATFLVAAGFTAAAGLLCVFLPGDLVKRCAPH